MNTTSLSAIALALGMTLSALPSMASTLDATQATIEQPASAENVLKRKIAIARFTNETQAANSFLVDAQGDRLGKQAADILSARLADTNKFIMFERLDGRAIDQEKLLNPSDNQAVPVEYLIVGSISEFGRSTESSSGIFSSSKMQKAYAKVNVRLIDVETGMIVESVEGAGEATTETKKTLGAGTSAGYDQSLTDKAFSEAISQLISNLVENMTSKPWTSYLLSQEDGTYIMAGGAAQGIATGQTFVVYKKGKKINNPQTGTDITLPGKKVGTVSVLSTYGENEFEQVSFVEVIDGQIGTDLSQYYLSDK
ncbi:CsgG/HfaB family protein [Shewanella sp. NIFS-20-20]|uniref:CsgG/HfaB family protein n=1 Tax=Shewanella sp. NIFS-20-20 TaxID=2853806 RepID=UPI001C454D40|nr:CsgG/HfaB family protein [Shewanella sp. NIFS-20-20]MBV7316547.1 CsgG/HfaB family protein [Shewanella sp. NIFS-20-20]